jgi:hypothetical protein
MKEAAKPADETTLKRLGGGRWQTRDERFTIEPQSGTWVVVDATQTDDLGLPLVRGPFGSLTAAKAAIEGARTSEPAISPLAAQVEEHRRKPVAAAKPAPKPPPKPVEPAAPPEPTWIRDLKPEERRRAHALMDRLTAAGVLEGEELARQEIVDHEAAVAAYAIERAIAARGPGATPAEVRAILADGEDIQLGVEWRLVDAEGRQINIGTSRAETSRAETNRAKRRSK